jgi:hypothetical protein
VSCVNSDSNLIDDHVNGDLILIDALALVRYKECASFLTCATSFDHFIAQLTLHYGER